MANALADSMAALGDQRVRGPVHPGGADRTRVELEHRHLERHGEGWEAMRDAVGSPNGWQGGLDLFAAAAAD